MTAQTVAPKRSRKQAAEPDDVLVARALAFSQWAKENIVAVVVTAVVLLVLIGGFMWMRYDRAATMERAAVEFLTLQQTIAAGNPDLAARELQSYIGRFGGTPYGAEARIMLGQLHLNGGDAAAAAAALEPFRDDIDDSPLHAQGAILLGDAQLEAADTTAAIASYLAVADEGEMSYQQVEGLQSAAMLRMQTGDYAGAAELYSRLAEIAEEGSMERAQYEMRRAEAEARAAAS